MFDTTTPEALRLDRPLALNAAVLLDAVSRSAGRAAQSLRDGSMSDRARLADERPRDRLGPSDALLLRHQVHDARRLR